LDETNFCPLSAESDLNQLTPQSDGNGVRAIVSTQFVHQVPDVKVNRSSVIASRPAICLLR
jgi:hypothetical protein